VQHPLQISRKIEYGLRAMTLLASLPEGEMVAATEISKRMSIPSDFLAKILKTLVGKKLVRSTRGSRGGYALMKPAKEISFLDVIEAVEGPVLVNVCAGTGESHDACKVSSACTMYSVWKWGQQKMLEVYRTVTLDQIAMKDLRREHPAVDLLQLPVHAANH
jgi:Rrf2 family protein